jgi:hypothetical protein
VNGVLKSVDPDVMAQRMSRLAGRLRNGVNFFKKLG